MHACGHDVHMTSLVGTARWLAEHKDRWSGTVVLIGQPAEEKIGGAKEMLADGLYTRFPKPDFALALHVLHDLEAGKVAYTSGPGDGRARPRSTSSSRGRGATAHARTTRSTRSSWPRSLVLDLQTIVSREVNPIAAGRGHRRLDPRRDQAQHHPQRGPAPAHPPGLQRRGRRPADRGDRRRAKGLAEAHRAPADRRRSSESTPPTVNTPAWSRRVVPMPGQGARRRRTSSRSSRRWGPRTSACSARGACRPSCSASARSRPRRSPRPGQGGEPCPSLHSALYQPDPGPSLRTGVRAMTAAVVGLLPPAEPPREIAATEGVDELDGPAIRHQRSAELLSPSLADLPRHRPARTSRR